MNLLMLHGEPGLIDDPQAPRILAAENLAVEEVGRLMRSCQPGRAAPHYCSWKAADEFETRAAEQEFRISYAPRLAPLAAAMPRGFRPCRAAPPGRVRPRPRRLPALLQTDARGR